MPLDNSGPESNLIYNIAMVINWHRPFVSVPGLLEDKLIYTTFATSVWSRSQTQPRSLSVMRERERNIKRQTERDKAREKDRMRDR